MRCAPRSRRRRFWTTVAAPTPRTTSATARRRSSIRASRTTSAHVRARRAATATSSATSCGASSTYVLAAQPCRVRRLGQWWQHLRVAQRPLFRRDVRRRRRLDPQHDQQRVARGGDECLQDPRGQGRHRGAMADGHSNDLSLMALSVIGTTIAPKTAVRALRIPEPTRPPPSNSARTN